MAPALSNYMLKNKKWIFVGIVAIVLVLIFIFFPKREKADASINIILSPYYDDAALSLGGLIAGNGSGAVVATFFTGMPEVATSTSWDVKSGFKDSSEAMKARMSENKKALENFGVAIYDYGYLDGQYRLASEDLEIISQNISKDIQALIASYSLGSTTVRIYGPADFGKEITHQDHKLLHDAYKNVIDSYPKSNVDFYFYEDFPYIERFNKKSAVSIQKRLETETGFLIDQEPVDISEQALSGKIRMIESYSSQIKALETETGVVERAKTYFSNRCGKKACEMTYKVFRSPASPTFSF